MRLAQLFETEKEKNDRRHHSDRKNIYRVWKQEIRMNWLSNNAYIAAWLSPLTTIIAVLIERRKSGRSKPINWSWMMIYMAFLTSFATFFSPHTEPMFRIVAGSVSGILCGWIMIDAIWPKKK